MMVIELYNKISKRKELCFMFVIMIFVLFCLVEKWTVTLFYSLITSFLIHNILKDEINVRRHIPIFPVTPIAPIISNTTTTDLSIPIVREADTQVFGEMVGVNNPMSSVMGSVSNIVTTVSNELKNDNDPDVVKYTPIIDQLNNVLKLFANDISNCPIINQQLVNEKDVNLLTYADVD